MDQSSTEKHFTDYDWNSDQHVTMPSTPLGMLFFSVCSRGRCHYLRDVEVSSFKSCLNAARCSIPPRHIYLAPMPKEADEPASQ